jgi:hypothetical protein
MQDSVGRIEQSGFNRRIEGAGRDVELRSELLIVKQLLIAWWIAADTPKQHRAQQGVLIFLFCECCSVPSHWGNA